MVRQDSGAEVRGHSEKIQDPHRSLHGETGARPGEHPGRSNNPLVKIAGLAWLEFEKPDLEVAGRFLADFGFIVAEQTPETLVLRGRQAGGGVPGGPPRRQRVTANREISLELQELPCVTAGAASAETLRCDRLARRHGTLTWENVLKIESAPGRIRTRDPLLRRHRSNHRGVSPGVSSISHLTARM